MRPLTILMTVLLIVALAACVAAPPPPEASICARTADHVRVESVECAPGSPALAAGTVRWYDADPACLDADDYTPVGAVAENDYLEGVAGCERESDEAAAHKAAKTTTTKKPAPTTTRKRPIARPTS